MPKSLIIDPQVVRKPGSIVSREIPVNAYRSDPEGEKTRYGSEALNRMWRDMCVIREFELSLQSIKQTGSYQGSEYDHKGPAHLSIGQESAAVGQAFNLGPDDLIFGSHRSHGEILAKGLSAIHKLPEAKLDAVLREYMDGAALRVVETQFGGDLRQVAEAHLLYGTLAEIFGRAAGFNRGLGGSMHAFFPPYGVMPNNAIVGGSADIAAGAALFKRVNHKPGLVVANIGDSSLGCGPTWEALVFSTMEQFRRLWDKSLGGGLPLLFNFVNNFYGMGGQPEGETMGMGILARVGAGLNAEAMHAERVDGFNPLAVADAIERKAKILSEGMGPVLLDTITYRFSGHSPSDASSYREKEELERWQQHDALVTFGRYLRDNGHTSEGEQEAWRAEISERMAKVMRLAVSLEISPRLDTSTDAIGDFMFSNRTAERMEEREPEVMGPVEENPRVQSIARKSRSGFAAGTRDALPGSKVVSLRDALFEAILHRFYHDPTLVAYGEENRDWGGAFAVYRGLTEALPYHRLFNTSISEGAIVGTGVGYALSGGRALVELMYNDFMGRAGDQIFNQMAKWQAMSGGVLTMPLVLRVSVGSKYGAQHSQDWTSMAAHVPGLKVMFPATPYDAKGMLNRALRGTDPVVFFESQRIYDVGEIFVEGGVPEGYYEVEEGQPALRRRGRDATLVTIGATLYRAMEAAAILESRYGFSAEVWDARFLNPLDYGPLAESVRRTGRCLLASDACERGSFLHTMASTLQELCFDRLDAPVAVVGARNWITPAAEMEDAFFPQAHWLVDAVHERLLPQKGHRVATNQTPAELLRRNRLGV